MGSPRIVIQRALCAIAGVDRETLAACPATDKLWATHLGLSLTLSFVVVFGISYHATSYVIENSVLRFAAALVIALTVFMFDRALYQSDWFSQGLLRGEERSEIADGAKPGLWRFLRISIRLAISFALAWVIALFLELAIFSDTITDKVKQDHLKANQATFQKIERYEQELDDDIVKRRKNLAALEALNAENLAVPAPQQNVPSSTLDQYESQLLALDKQEEELRGAVREINGEITRYSEEMNAEERGQKLKPGNSGRAGMGPRYYFAQQQRDLFLQQRAEREKELAALQTRRAELRSIQADVRKGAQNLYNQERQTHESGRQNLQAQVDAARRDLQALEAARSNKVEAFRKEALSSPEFQKQKDDPLSRMTAYQKLHNDPIDGPTITLFSWMTKLLVIFLEIVPVVAKIFFSPPSVYAAIIQAQVARARARVFDDNERPEIAAPRFMPAVSEQPSVKIDWDLPKPTKPAKQRQEHLGEPADLPRDEGTKPESSPIFGDDVTASANVHTSPIAPQLPAEPPVEFSPGEAMVWGSRRASNKNVRKNTSGVDPAAATGARQRDRSGIAPIAKIGSREPDSSHNLKLQEVLRSRGANQKD